MQSRVPATSVLLKPPATLHVEVDGSQEAMLADYTIGCWCRGQQLSVIVLSR